jgi:predicted adenine nucleotide alpha hydrolase (AANH) superfamily ATPase
VEASAGRARCSKQFALTAEKNVRFLSSLLKVDQFTAKMTIQSTKNTNRIDALGFGF